MDKSDNNNLNSNAFNTNTKLIENVDYYLDENGLMVFTAAYHLKRGYCCKNACRHCPYDFKAK